jgi:cell division septum initiation protein DivIVA
MNFTTVRKGGYDPNEVRIQLESVAREMGHLEARIRELQDQLSEAHRRAANPTFDEATLAGALGAQSAAILRSAHEEAGRVTAEAQERSAQVFTESQQRSSAHLIEAQERAAALISEAESTAGQIDHDARLAAERLVESAKVNGEALVEGAREQGRAIVEQSYDARKAVLNDLAVKRKALQIQIEQLRAARDVLATFVTSVQDQVEGVLSGINNSDDVARNAALEALRLRPNVPEPTEEEVLASTPLRQVAEPQLQDVTDLAIDARPRGRRAPKDDATSVADITEVSMIDDDGSGTDVVNEIFARLRKATLEERGAAPVPKRAAPAPTKAPTVTGELLERLRDVKAMITTELEDEHKQRARYADAAIDALTDAAAAGVQFAKDEAGVSGGAVVSAALQDCAADLAVTIVLALRKRILTDGSGDGPDRANAAYKEWRGARVERLCTDAARRAFEIGVVAASRGRHVRFFVAPNDAPCDACAMDAGSGERPAGENFPSGSPFPPLHAGCACAVIPV